MTVAGATRSRERYILCKFIASRIDFETTTMSGAEFELALAVLDTAIKVAKEIKDFMERYRGALKSLDMLATSVALATCKTEEFYSTLKSGEIPTRYHGPITRAVEILNPKLDELNAVLQSYGHFEGNIGSIDRAHWAAFGERRAKRVQVEIEEWNRNVFELVVVTLLAGNRGHYQPHPGDKQLMIPMREPKLELIKRVPGLAATLSMQGAVATAFAHDFGNPFAKSESQNLELPSSTLGRMTFQDYDDETSLTVINGYKSLLEHIYVNDISPIADMDIRNSVSDLALILSRADPEICYIPTCKGFFKDTMDNRYSLVFSGVFRFQEVEYTLTQHSLSSGISLLQRMEPNQQSPHESAIIDCLQDLESRNKLAIQLIHALSYIHAIGWVHKGLKSSKILLSVDGRGNVKPLVVGFHDSRPANGRTSGRQDYEDYLYRHPDRWQTNGNPTFRRRYDVYSLAVVLLELGMGRLIHNIIRPHSHKKRFLMDATSRKQAANEIVDLFIGQARRLKMRQGRTYADSLEAGFRSTSVLQQDIGDTGDEEDSDLCRNLLSKWVTELSSTQF